MNSPKQQNLKPDEIVTSSDFEWNYNNSKKQVKILFFCYEKKTEKFLEISNVSNKKQRRSKMGETHPPGWLFYNVFSALVLGGFNNWCMKKFVFFHDHNWLIISFESIDRNQPNFSYKNIM